MIIRLILLFLLWLVIRRIWRSFALARSESRSKRRSYPGPDRPEKNGKDLGDITQQEISDAEFEELDDK